MSAQQHGSIVYTQALASDLMRSPVWRMLLSGNRDRIAQAVKQINASGKTDDYAALLLIIRRRRARRAVVSFVPVTISYTERERRSALTALGLLWGTVGRELAMALDPKATHFERRHAHEALIRRRDQRAVRPLIDALMDGHALEDWQCIPTLGALGDLRAADALLRYMGIPGYHEVALGKRLDLGIDIGRALRNLNARDAIQTVKDVVQSPIGDQRAAAALILAGWGDPSLANLLLPLLEDRMPSVRIAALTALGDLQAVEAMNLLERCLADPDPDVRVAAERAFQQISTEHARRAIQAGKSKDQRSKKPNTIPQK